MKNNWYFYMLGLIFLISCSGESGNTVSDNKEEGVSGSDSIASGPAFERFVTYVNDLESALENTDSLWSHYESMKAEFSQEEKDSAFFVVREYYSTFEVTEEEAEDYSEEGQKKMQKKYKQYGFEVWWEEGYAYLVSDLKFLKKKFKGDISAELDDYLDVRNELDVQVTSDAGLIISWSELADMILTCEDYLAENSDSKYADQVLSLYLERMNFLMWGLDNTPTIDFWSDETEKHLDSDVSDVYQKLIKDTKHKTGKIIADHLTWLESRNFEYTYEEVNYLSSSEARMYLGIE